MNEGELLYQGEPTALTQTMAGRSFLMTSPHEGNRKLLQRALKLPQVSDGMIQGKSVRLILKKRDHTRRYSPCGRDAGNQHQRNYAAF